MNVLLQRSEWKVVLETYGEWYFYTIPIRRILQRAPSRIFALKCSTLLTRLRTQDGGSRRKTPALFDAVVAVTRFFSFFFTSRHLENNEIIMSFTGRSTSPEGGMAAHAGSSFAPSVTALHSQIRWWAWRLASEYFWIHACKEYSAKCNCIGTRLPHRF